MRSDAWAGNGRMTWFRCRCDGSAMGQDDDRALAIEKPDHVVVVGDEGFPDIGEDRIDPLSNGGTQLHWRRRSLPFFSDRMIQGEAGNRSRVRRRGPLASLHRVFPIPRRTHSVTRAFVLSFVVGTKRSTNLKFADLYRLRLLTHWKTLSSRANGATESMLHCPRTFSHSKTA